MAETRELEDRLEELLDQETFAPPEEFTESADVTDEKIYEEADKDFEAFWAEQAKALKWQEDYDQVLDWSDPPFAKWFVGGKLNVAENCVDRHVEDGNGDRVAFHWRGEEGEEEDITYADLHRDVQKFANALKDLGVEKGDVVGIFLPMIPEVVVAMLACARIGAPHNVVFGGFSPESVKERMEVSEAKAAGDRRRRPPQGQDQPGQGGRRRGDGRPEVARDDRRRQADRRGRADAGRARPLVPRAAREGRRRVPARADGLRGPAVHPLLVGLDGQAEGHPAHDGRLPHGRRLHAQAGVRPQARGGRVLVLGRRRLDHRALLHRLRAARQRHDVGDVRGRARLPGQGHLVGARRALRRLAVLHRADRDPRRDEVGQGAPREARPVVAAAARHGR